MFEQMFITRMFALTKY